MDDLAVLDQQGAGHRHAVVVGVAADEAEDRRGAVLPTVLENAPRVGVEAAERFIEKQDVAGPADGGALSDDQSRLSAVSGGQLAIGLFDIEFDFGSQLQCFIEALRKQGSEDRPGGKLRIKAKILGEILHASVRIEGAFQRLYDAGDGAEQGRLAAAVPGKEEVGAFRKPDLFGKRGQRLLVADGQSAMESQGGETVVHAPFA